MLCVYLQNLEAALILEEVLPLFKGFYNVFLHKLIIALENALGCPYKNLSSQTEFGHLHYILIIIKLTLLDFCVLPVAVTGSPNLLC